MSGAGDIKDDGHDDDYVVEVKDAPRNFTLKGADISALHRRAARQGKLSMWIVRLEEYGLVCEVHVKPERTQV